MSHTQAQFLGSDWTGPVEGCVWDCHKSPGTMGANCPMRYGDKCAYSYLISICKNGQEESRQYPKTKAAGVSTFFWALEISEWQRPQI